MHAADLHLDTPFSGIGRVAPEVGQALQDASLTAWDNLVRLTLAEGADVLLLAGDIYDGEERGLRAQLRLLAGLERLAAAGVRTFIVHGNHDPLNGQWSAVRRWPDGVHIFGSECVQRVPLGTVGGVSGISFGQREERRDLASLFARPEGDGLEIGLLHCSVDRDPAHAVYAPTTRQALVAADLDYWALGHVHARRELHGGRPWIEYPGNLQGRSPAPGELGPKGALVLRAEVPGGVVEPPRFVALDAVRFLVLEVDVSAADGVPAALNLVGEAARAARDEHAGRGLVVRLTLTGRGQVGTELRLTGGAELLRQLREEAVGLEPFLWWEQVGIAVGDSIRRDALLGRGDFVAELLAQVDRLGAEPVPFVREAARLAPTIAGRAELGELDAESARALLRAAEERCLELLLPAGGEQA